MAAFPQGHALVVGVGSYQQSEYSVPITLGDAQGVYDALISDQVCGYPPKQVAFLHDDGARKADLQDALSDLAARAHKEDTVFIFLAGHGAPTANDDWAFGTHDAELDDLTGIAVGTGVSGAELFAALRKIKAQKLLVIINACFSGMVGPRLAPGAPPPPKRLGTAPPDKFADKLLASGEGRAIITASRANQFSMFDEGAPRTYFGSAFIDALNGAGVTDRGGYIALYELYEAVYRRVVDDVKRYRDKQEPVLTVLENVGPFPVALYRGKTPGNLAAAGFSTQPPAGAAVRIMARNYIEQLTIQGDAVLGDQIIHGDYVRGDKVMGDKTEEHIGGDKNVVNIGAGATVGQVAAGRGIVQTTTQPTAGQQGAALFATIYNVIEARAEDPNVDKSELKGKVELIQQEAAKGEGANPIKVERWLKELKNAAPDVFQITALAVASAPGTPAAVRAVAQNALSS